MPPQLVFDAQVVEAPTHVKVVAPQTAKEFEVEINKIAKKQTKVFIKKVNKNFRASK